MEGRVRAERTVRLLDNECVCTLVLYECVSAQLQVRRTHTEYTHLATGQLSFNFCNVLDWTGLDLTGTMVDLPDTMVDLPDTMVDLHDTMRPSWHHGIPS